MDYIGTGRRLAQGDVGEAARWLGVETAVLLAFMEVETAGRGFDKLNRPKMLFEPHVFWRELGAGQARDTAVRLGIAYKDWGEKKYPPDSYPRLKQAATVSERHALRSSSWGLGQILGSNYAGAGHISEQTFVRANMQGEREQVLAMVALMRAWGMVPMLTGKDFSEAASWEPAAGKWNGKAFRKHNYHGRMATAYVKHTKGEPMVTPTSPAILLRGMKGEEVRNLQSDLAALGYVFDHGIDGRFGDETDKHVRDFQTKGALTVDGKVGDGTRKAIAAALQAMEADKSPPTPEWSGQGKRPSSGPAADIVAILIGIGAAIYAFLKSKGLVP